MSFPAAGLKRICELNAHGILALARYKVDKGSILAIKEAMLAMDHLCAVSDGGFQASPDASLAFRVVPVPGLDDGNFYIYNHAFLVSPAMMNMQPGGPQQFLPQGVLSSTNMAVFCAILTFNMALTYHQLGQQSGDSRKLRTACLLYGNCMEMASSVEGLPQPAVGDDLFILHMVAMNNAAQIQYTLANFAESDQLLTHVRRMMLQLLDRDRTLGATATHMDLVSMLPRECMDEINLNCAVCIKPHTAPTA
ncbi:expressed unknown protein [Seminavis robusta]|uniref:Uncharacterized protein n=1 Tax=Seminavis robusta TaxID=568900 RepID=A0A9N8EGN7_9STRA|nr:expressed unknown protein [Seminavis robusta]|eukprot:Sro973_g226690.1 n/a (251) ;mRNA; f:31660-32412